MPIRSLCSIDSAFRVGPIDRRLFGSFVEHIGRCVYGGIYEKGSPFSDEEGLRTDVIELTKELGTSVVRYPGGNFVSGYRWEDGIGPPEARPRRLDLAWKSVESNEFGLHEFMSWALKSGVEPMMVVNLGTRGIEAACDLLEYANYAAGTALSDLRRHNGSVEPFGVKLWCLGNEVDGPWQLGHKTADAYGALAAEAAKAMRRLDPTIELAVCGSSTPNMPTFGSWEETVLGHTLDVVDFISVHAYFKPHGDDIAGFLASGSVMDRYISAVVAAADHAAAKSRSSKHLYLAFDEWNVWHSTGEGEQRHFESSHPPRINENQYSGLDAVVVGGLMISLLRHCDRVKIACLAQLVNVIAPIWAEPGCTAWRQTIFYPFALTARHCRGETLAVEISGDLLETAEHGQVPVADVVATSEDSTGDITILAVNRHPIEHVQLDIALRGFGKVQLVDHMCLGGIRDQALVNTAERPNAVVVRPAHGTVLQSSNVRTKLEPASWNLLRLSGAS